MVPTKAESYLVLAAEDFELAALPTTRPRLAAYHLSQAAEKAARAVCEHAGIQVGTTHNIGHIGSMLPSEHPLRNLIEAQNHLSTASTKYRYPDVFGRVPKEPSETNIRIMISEVRDFVEVVKDYVNRGLLPTPIGRKPGG